MGIGDIISWVFKLKILEKYRTKLGLLAVVIGGAMGTILSPEFVAEFGLEDLPNWLTGVGTYIALVGSRYKDDYPTT